MIADLLQRMDLTDLSEAAELVGALYAARLAAQNAHLDANYRTSADAEAERAEAEADGIREDLTALLEQYDARPKRSFWRRLWLIGAGRRAVAA